MLLVRILGDGKDDIMNAMERTQIARPSGSMSGYRTGKTEEENEKSSKSLADILDRFVWSNGIMRANGNVDPITVLSNLTGANATALNAFEQEFGKFTSNEQTVGVKVCEYTISL